MRSYSVYCDAPEHVESCPFGTGYWGSSKDARAEAVRQGWTRDASAPSALDRKDYSPECTAALNPPGGTS